MDGCAGSIGVRSTRKQSDGHEDSLMRQIVDWWRRVEECGSAGMRDQSRQMSEFEIKTMAQNDVHSTIIIQNDNDI